MGQPVSPSTDVYSLGVLLYELLAGRKPYEVDVYTPGEIERVVCGEDPCKPSAMLVPELVPYTARALQGDLDNIILKAMQKEPAQRYATVQAMAEDLQRYSDGFPVLARPVTPIYRMRRMVRRHRARVVAASVVAVALLVGAVATAWQARVARQEHSRAEQRLHEVRRMANDLLAEGDAVAALPGGTAMRARLIERALQSLDQVAKENSMQHDPTLQQELAVAYEKMGDAQGRQDGPNLGDTRGALASYRKAVAIREALRAVMPKDREARRGLAVAYARLSGALKVSGDYRQGLEFDRKALAVRQELLAESPQDIGLQREVAANLTTLGGSLFQVGDWDGVLRHRRDALTMYQTIVAAGKPTKEDYLGLSLAYTRMGSVLVRSRAYAEAVRDYQEAVRVADLGYAKFPSEWQLRQRAATAWQAMGSASLAQGRTEEALFNFRKAHAIYSDLYDRDPQEMRSTSLLALSHFRIGQAELSRHNFDEAEQRFRTALQIRKQLVEKNPLNAGARGEVAESYAGLGDLAAAMGRNQQARTWYSEAKQVLHSLADEQRANSATHQELARIEQAEAKLGAAK